MIRVLIVDDSAVVRTAFRTALAADPEIHVVGAAPDPYVARQLVAQENPDVICLDVEMPRMDGLTFLRKLMQHHPVPVVIVSSLATDGSPVVADALACGAVEVLCKPNAAYSAGAMGVDLVRVVKAAAASRVERLVAPRASKALAPLSRTTQRVVALGASTGGTVAIERVLSQLPVDAPGTVITQHMPAGFTRSFAARLNERVPMQVREAGDGDLVTQGLALIAPGNRHMVLRRSGSQYLVRIKDGPRVTQHRPSIDVMFRSVANAAGANAVGVLLTGMGADGARGLGHLRSAGAATLAQDEASCVVYGMPRVAVELGHVDEVVGLDEMPATILRQAA